jgi:hypothetical protein
MALSNKQINEISVHWNLVVHRIFSYIKWASVKAVQLGLIRLSVKHLIMLGNVKFHRHLRNMFCVFMLHYSNDDFYVYNYISDISKSCGQCMDFFSNICQRPGFILSVYCISIVSVCLPACCCGE